MVNKNIEFEIEGLKCDNPTCDYSDMTVKEQDYEQYINFPCPKCGSPILTQADYDNVQLLRQIETESNKVCPFVEKGRCTITTIKVPCEHIKYQDCYMYKTRLGNKKRSELLMDGSGQIKIKNNFLNTYQDSEQNATTTTK